MSKAERDAIKAQKKKMRKGEEQFAAFFDMDRSNRRASFDSVVQLGIELGGVVVSESQIEPRRQPERVVSIVQPVNAAPAAQAIPEPQRLPKSAASALACMVEIDPGISPLIFHQDMETPYRLWLIAKHIDSNGLHPDTPTKGRGFFALKTLQDALPAFDVYISSRHFKRAIRQGEGVFWEQKRTGYRLTGKVTLWDKFSERLCQQDKQCVVEACRPATPVYIAPGSSLQDFKATLYTAWIDSRNINGEGVQLSRFFLCQVWKCSENTLRSWEQGRVDHTANYAQYAGNDPRVIPAYATPYPDRNGVVRYTWRRPNTYTSTETIIEHRAKGQKSKARNARNHILKMYQLDAIPADLCAAETIGKLYFTDKVDAPGSAFKAIRYHLRKHQDYQRLHFARLGTKQGYKSAKPVGIWEVTTGTQLTGLDDRDFAQERRKAFRVFAEFDTAMREKYSC